MWDGSRLIGVAAFGGAMCAGADVFFPLESKFVSANALRKPEERKSKGSETYPYITDFVI